MRQSACQCIERNHDTEYRKWEIVRKTGKGAWVRCLACGAFWYTEARYVAAMPYSIGPVEFPPPARQHVRCTMALIMLAAVLLWSRDRIGVLEPVPGLWKKTWDAIAACRPGIRHRRTSVAAEKKMANLRAIADAVMGYESHGPQQRTRRDIGAPQHRCAELFVGLDTYLCGTIATCPQFSSGPEWQVLRELSDRWAGFWLERCPAAEDPAEALYERLLEETRR